MFQNAVKAAAELKSKQLRSRPGRQVWEQAPEFLRLTAANDEEITNLRASPLTQRMEAAHQLRELGSNLARGAEQEDALVTAIRQYARGLSIFVWFDRGQDNAAEDIPLVDSIARLEDEQQAEQAKQLCVVLLNNIATCLLRLQCNEDAIYAASKALEFDPYNARALFRRAMGSHKQGTNAGLEQAVKDLQAALSYEPGNAQVRTCLAAFQAELLEQRRKERAMYSSMLPKEGGLYSDFESEDVLNIKSKKHMPDTEVHSLVRDMQRNMSKVQAAEAAKKHSAQQQPGSFNFPKLPWWAWLIVAAHLLYRITKIFGSRKHALTAEEANAEEDL